jgi:aminoglycoside phosphotransferase (APT) family kinase protein
VTEFVAPGTRRFALPSPFAMKRGGALHDAQLAYETWGRLDAARFKTFVHGDAKLENVCFQPAGHEVALVDFQYVGGGVGVKDVAYFLSSCLAVRECESLVPRYLDEYFRALVSAVRANAAGAGVDVAALESEWRALFPLAWVDFYRFLLGWSPGQLDGDPYSERLTREVLRGLKSD